MPFARTRCPGQQYPREASQPVRWDRSARRAPDPIRVAPDAPAPTGRSDNCVTSSRVYGIVGGAATVGRFQLERQILKPPSLRRMLAGSQAPTLRYPGVARPGVSFRTTRRVAAPRPRCRRAAPEPPSGSHPQRGKSGSPSSWPRSPALVGSCECFGHSPPARL